MKSRWYRLKAQALHLRKRGHSTRYIEATLGIPKSTLSFWFQGIILTEKQRNKLLQNWREGLVRAREKAVVWHNAQKAARLLEAKQEAESTLKNVRIERNILDLALAMLYLGEGFKKSIGTAMGNSDPMILKFFISILQTNYGLRSDQVKCELHLRADQDEEKLKRFWSRQLKVPIKNFTKTSFDIRTKNSSTFSSYRGVCVVRLGGAAIQRKLIYLSQMFCEQVIRACSSAG